jgi:hypothetical protein
MSNSLIDSASRNEYVRLEWVQHDKMGSTKLQREVITVPSHFTAFPSAAAAFDELLLPHL